MKLEFLSTRCHPLTVINLFFEGSQLALPVCLSVNVNLCMQMSVQPWWVPVTKLRSVFAVSAPSLQRVHREDKLHTYLWQYSAYRLALCDERVQCWC